MPEKRFQLLEVDLSRKSTRTVDVTEDVRQFLGGRSLGAKILWDSVPPGADPLGEENGLYVGIGPITGLMGSVTNVSAKSPLTHLRGESNMNGHFGVELVYASSEWCRPSQASTVWANCLTSLSSSATSVSVTTLAAS